LFGLAASWRQKRTNRLKRLAERLDGVAAEDDRAVGEAARLDALRRTGAAELHDVCRRFADALNSSLTRGAITLDPPEFLGNNFHDSGPHLFQLNVRGRIVQVMFEASGLSVSTEQYREAYILEGSVRSFNRDLLDRNMIEEHQLFLCLRRVGCQWRFHDSRTNRGGAFDVDYLAGILERLI